MSNVDRAVEVEGVGNGMNGTQTKATVPGVAVDVAGKAHSIHFEAPVLPDSNVPALWGHMSLRRHRAILDMVNQKLYLCGPGAVRFTPPPGSHEFPLIHSASGHLLLPITEFETLSKQLKTGRQKTDASPMCFQSGDSEEQIPSRKIKFADEIETTNSEEYQIMAN